MLHFDSFEKLIQEKEDVTMGFTTEEVKKQIEEGRTALGIELGSTRIKAVLVAEDGSVFQAPAPKGKLVNGVGAGDSMVAGFLAGWMERRDYRHAFYMGISAGSASAFSEQLATREEIEAVYGQMQNTYTHGR